MKTLSLLTLIICTNILLSQSKNHIENDCWESVSDYDTLVLLNKNYLLISPIDSLDFESVLSKKNKYNPIDKNVEVNKFFLKCTYRNGKSEIFKNNFKPGFETYVNHIFYGTIESLDYYVFRVNYYENSIFILVDKENGTKIVLIGEPIFSISKKYIACGISTCIGNGGGFNIFEVNNNGRVTLLGSEIKYHNWDPSQLKWNQNNELLIQKDRGCFDCSIKKYAKLVLFNGGKDAFSQIAEKTDNSVKPKGVVSSSQSNCDEKNVYLSAEQMPEFPGGPGEMMRFVSKNTQYPQEAREAGISGKCFLSFVVGCDGKIRDVKVSKGVPGCLACDSESVRVVNNFPAFKPGKEKGVPVSVQITIPFNFSQR